jgi:quercetin dioxygenase-like cupin family protein
MFGITRVYSDSNGESHFEDIEIPLKDGGEIGFLSEKIQTTEVIFRKVKPAYDFDFHNAPRRQYIILLDGEIEIETSLGEKRIFKGGDVLLMEDTQGKGHKTKNLQSIERRSIFITL